ILIAQKYDEGQGSEYALMVSRGQQSPGPTTIWSTVALMASSRTAITESRRTSWPGASIWLEAHMQVHMIIELPFLCKALIAGLANVRLQLGLTSNIP
ncbi:hypothetical protein, partial [Streptomyces sp. NPDC021139]|uniref:hypothetical protein n=1 Tax=Streptomyces sp. NPDC021139 TaxID=3154899 RepID=UPI0033D197A0